MRILALMIITGVFLVMLFLVSVEFLDRCNNHGILIYQSDEIGMKQSYGVLV